METQLIASTLARRQVSGLVLCLSGWNCEGGWLMHGNQVSESSFIVSSSLQRELTESGGPPPPKGLIAHTSLNICWLQTLVTLTTGPIFECRLVNIYWPKKPRLEGCKAPLYCPCPTLCWKGLNKYVHVETECLHQVLVYDVYNTPCYVLHYAHVINSYRAP